jgi:hypothetical protein
MKAWVIGGVVASVGVVAWQLPTASGGTMLGGTLVGGGKKADSDCYAEAAVYGFEGLSDKRIVTDNKGSTITCTDGESCDAGPCGDDQCDMQVKVCVNQTAPNLPSCTAPSGLDELKIKGKGKNKRLINIQAPQALQGAFCFGASGGSSSVAGAFGLGSAQGAFLLELPAAEVKSNGKVKGGSVVVTGKAKAPKGAKPRVDPDKFTFQCLPRTSECPSSPSGAFLD